MVIMTASILFDISLFQKRKTFAMANKPMRRPRSCGGDSSCTIACPMEEKVRFNTPAVKRSSRDRIASGKRKSSDRETPHNCADHRGTDPRRKPAASLEHEPADHRPRHWHRAARCRPVEASRAQIGANSASSLGTRCRQKSTRSRPVQPWGNDWPVTGNFADDIDSVAPTDGSSCRRGAFATTAGNKGKIVSNHRVNGK